MPTIAQVFYAKTTNNDFTDPSPGDYRKLEETVPAAADSTTRADLGTSGSKDVVFRPFVTNTTSGSTDISSWGWVINFGGTDGMGGTATDKRYVPAGDWVIAGRVSANLAALNAVTIWANVHKRNADGTRSIMGWGSHNLGLLATTGANFSCTANCAETQLAANETILISVYANGTGQVGGLIITCSLSTSTTTTLRATTPTPGVRTNYLRSHTMSQSLSTILGRRTVSAFKSVSLSLSVAYNRLAIIARAFSVSLSLSVALSRYVRLAAKTVSLSLTVGISKWIRLAAKVVNLSLITGVIKKVFRAYAVNLALSASYLRALQAYRAFSSSLNLSSAYSRALVAVRNFTASLSLTSLLHIKMRQDVLNRFTGGQSIIKKVFHVFEDY